VQRLRNGNVAHFSSRKGTHQQATPLYLDRLELSSAARLTVTGSLVALRHAPWRGKRRVEKQGLRDGFKEKPRARGASPRLANVRTAWRVGGDLALSSRAYACSVAAETYLNRASKNDLSCCRSLPEVGSRNWARVGWGFLLGNPGSFYGRTRTSAADCAGGNQRHSNRKSDQLHGPVVLHGRFPNSIAGAYRRRRFQACDGHHKGTTISEDTRTQSLHEKSPTSAGSLALRDNPIAGPSRHPYLIKQQQLRFHRQCNGNLDNGPGRHRIEAPKFDISVGAVTGLS
jgi:hypothetical protein